MDWSRLARAYAWQLPLERAALAAAIKLGDPTADDALLDVGTGSGALLRELAKHPGRPRIAIGIDECPAMLERARALPAGWSVQAADARRLPFADGTFSIVTAISCCMSSTAGPAGRSSPRRAGCCAPAAGSSS